MQGGHQVTGPTACGAFTFTSTASPVFSQVGFLFNPTACGAPPCACNTVAYVQMVRLIDKGGGYMQPFGEQSERMVMGRGKDYDGWAIDRLNRRIWGYYGRNDDERFSDLVQTGSNQSTALLKDWPDGWDPGSHFSAVSASVCIDKLSPCLGRILGYEYWSFLVGSKPTAAPTPSAYPIALGFAIAEWNADADQLGKQPLPDLPPWH